MWLHDFLPREIQNARIMTYGYNSSFSKLNANSSNLYDYANDALQQIEKVRSLNKSRPIVFIGHSLGCILISKILLKAKNNEPYNHILSATRGIIFFGAPHHGMRSEDLTNLVNSQLEGRVLESKRKLIDQLRTNSVFLDDHNADLTSVWDQLSGKVTGFYETENSPTMQKDKDGSVSRDGPTEFKVSRSWHSCTFRVRLAFRYTRITQTWSNSTRRLILIPYRWLIFWRNVSAVLYLNIVSKNLYPG
ncbi:hypothetical protein FPQ18DRAFT_172068 [Pyronema domesticum]|nr:hypothetical protein FPQ18DRAFT_172068 [Pyronema domesticum]